MRSVPGTAALPINCRVALHPQLFERMESMGAPVATGPTLSPLCASISATRNDSKTVTKRPLSKRKRGWRMRLSHRLVCKHTRCTSRTKRNLRVSRSLLHKSTAVFPELKIFPQATMLTESFLYSLPFIIFKIGFCSLNIFQVAEASTSISICFKAMTSQKKKKKKDPLLRFSLMLTFPYQDISFAGSFSAALTWPPLRVPVIAEAGAFLPTK